MTNNADIMRARLRYQNALLAHAFARSAPVAPNAPQHLRDAAWRIRDELARARRHWQNTLHVGCADARAFERATLDAAARAQGEVA